jgi:hypothetical protein
MTVCHGIRGFNRIESKTGRKDLAVIGDGGVWLGVDEKESNRLW